MNDRKILEHDEILQSLQEALEPLVYVIAMWEGGSVAFDTHDEWSDIDLQIGIMDGRTMETVTIVEDAFRSLSKIELKYEIPQPTWHGHWQAFYRLERTNPYLLMDFVIMEESNPEKFLEPEIHSNRVIYFDKNGFTEGYTLDKEAHLEKIKARMQKIKLLFDMFQVMVTKGFPRNRPVESFHFYYRMTLAPLVMALRIKHCPQRYDFETSRFYFDLPEQIVRRLEPFYFVSDSAALKLRHQEAETWFREAMAEIDLDEVAQKLAEA